MEPDLRNTRACLHRHSTWGEKINQPQGRSTKQEKFNQTLQENTIFQDIINLSNHILTSGQNTLLAKGFNFMPTLETTQQIYYYTSYSLIENSSKGP